MYTVIQVIYLHKPPWYTNLYLTSECILLLLEERRIIYLITHMKQNIPIYNQRETV